MKQPTLPDLLKKVQVTGGRKGYQSVGTVSDEVLRDLAVDKAAFRAIQALDDSPLPITEDQVSYLCDVIATRVEEVGRA